MSNEALFKDLMKDGTGDFRVISVNDNVLAKGHCACGKHGIRHEFVISDGKTTFTIGSKCITVVMSIISGQSTSLETDIKREKKKIAYQKKVEKAKKEWSELLPVFKTLTTEYEQYLISKNELTPYSRVDYSAKLATLKKLHILQAVKELKCIITFMNTKMSREV